MIIKEDPVAGQSYDALNLRIWDDCNPKESETQSNITISKYLSTQDKCNSNRPISIINDKAITKLPGLRKEHDY